MFTLKLSDGELYEIGDAIVPALDALLVSGDSNNYEAKYGSASNLVSVIRKIWEVRSPGNPPEPKGTFTRKVSVSAYVALSVFQAVEGRLAQVNICG